MSFHEIPSRARPTPPAPDGTAPNAPFPAKFSDPFLTASGEKRAWVSPAALETVWLNTGTLCNITCENCYIESSPRNDRLAYLTLGDVTAILDEIRGQDLKVREIGITGGEPFMNPDIDRILAACLEAGMEVLVLTNAMTPFAHHRAALSALDRRHRGRLKMRVSLDHYDPTRHEAERGANSFAPALAGLQQMVADGLAVTVAGRRRWGEEEDALRDGFGRLFTANDIPLNARDPAHLVLFPEMTAAADISEIGESCWARLGVDPGEMMCARSRMVVRRRGARQASILACTLIPYDPRFELGETLAEAMRPVSLQHRHCAQFCVLGGGSCSGG